MKKIILIFLLFVSLYPLYAQISEGGTPPSFAFSRAKYLKTELLPYKAILKTDVKHLQWEDSITDKNGIPERLAIIIPSQINFADSAKLLQLPNGKRIRQLVINADQAYGIILSYSHFSIPAGGKLFIYNKSTDQVLGAYTSKTNPLGAEFSTEIVYGDELTLEYEEGADQLLPEIIITGIGYIYSNITKKSDGNISGSCQVNINCTEGANWQHEKKGIAKTLTMIGSHGWYKCSGTLVNNTNLDMTPYFLTANHCFYVGSTQASFSTMQFYFNYETQGCDDESRDSVNARTNTLIGAQLLASTSINGGSDGALLKLNNKIPEEYDVCYNGWNRTNTAATSGVCIHHPEGDVKKISTYTSTLRTGTYSDIDNGTGASNSYWVTSFISGTTEGGSSGSPLFNQDGLVVGTLTGGESSCQSPTGSDYYGKLWAHWDQSANNNDWMQPYLDPTNKGVTSLKRLNSLADLEVSLDTLNIKLNTSFKINITKGNEGYIINNDNPSIASSLIIENATEQSITISALKEGQTILTLSDQMNYQKKIVVNVFPEDSAPIIFKYTDGVLSFSIISAEDDNNPITSVKIMDLSNRILYKKNNLKINAIYNVDTLAWAKGVYVVVLDRKNGSKTVKKITW